MKKSFLFNLAALVTVLLGWNWSATAQTTSYTSVGTYTFTVPAGVSMLAIDMAGGQGGSSYYSSVGGKGGRAQGALAVTPGQQLYVYVGGQGTNSTTTSGTRAGGANGAGGGAQGGQGNGYGGGGGGASDVRVGGTALTNRVMVGSGGGGAGMNCASSAEWGGAGGGLTGDIGANCGSVSACVGGSGGTQSAGGLGATCYGYAGSNGSLGAGGQHTSTNYTGGGGGGYYGGGAGAYGGGGGGSSYIGGTGVSVASTTADYRTGVGYVNLTPALPTVTVSPSTLTFPGTAPSTTAAFMVYSFTGIYLTSGGTFTITSSSSFFEVSTDGLTWGSTATYPYTGTSVTGSVLVRFTPNAVGAFSGTVAITGGGLASAVNVAVNGTGSAACSAAPSAGTAGAAPGSGNGATAITLTLSGGSSGGSLTYQWQYSYDNTTFFNVGGATTNPYVYTGLTANTYFRCVSTCPSFGSANSASTLVTFTFPSTSCSAPTFTYTCPSYPMNIAIASLVGYSGTLADPVTTTCAANYEDKTGLAFATLVQGTTYSITLAASPSYYSSFTSQVWIDFNDNGTFDNTTETVAGLPFGGFTAATRVTTLTVPATAGAGTHRMRMVGYYNSGTAPAYPAVLSCPTTATNYGNVRDYKVTIIPAPPAASVAPSSLAFGNVTTSSTSGSVPPRSFLLNASGLIPSAGLINVTPPSGWQVSTDGVSWTGSVLGVFYSGSALVNKRIYARFIPSSGGAASGNITVSGAGLAASVNLAVTGTGTAVCSGTPTAGTAAISPTSGNPNTNFTLTLSGTSASGGLAYQWQKSTDGGTTWVNMPEGLYSSITFTGIALATQFRCVVTCSASGLASTTAAVSATFSSPSYCTPAYLQTCSSYPMNIGIATLTGSSGTLADPVTSTCASNYEDKTALATTTLVAGTTYSGTIATSPSYYSSFSMTVWIDFDNDGVFASGETVAGLPFGGITSPSMATSFVIPSTAINGSHRMRIMGNYNSGALGYPSMNPCATTANYGNVRDYLVTISGGVAPGAVACSGAASAGISSAYNSFGCSAFNAYLFNTDESVGGFSYNWQLSTTSATAGFSNISGATNSAYFPTVSTPGTYYYRNTVTCGASTASTSAITVTMSNSPDLSNFTSPTATNSCSGSGSVVTVNSTTLGAGTYNVTYNLTGANTATGAVATLTMGAASGTFNIPAASLGTNGATSVTITAIATLAGCSTSVSSSNTAGFAVGTNPNITNFTSPSAATVCAGVSSTGTINSTTLGVGTYTVVYTLSAPNASVGNTAVLTMGASSGTFTIPGTLLNNAGSTTLTINSITNSTGCSVNTTTSNTTSFTVNSAAGAFSMTGGGSYCTGGSGLAVGISTSTSGSNYQLYLGSTPVGSAVAGTGSPISFGTFTATGTYTVQATATSAPFCTRNCTGTSVVTVTSPPNVYSIAGGGTYCAGVTASAPLVYLSASDNGVLYSLFVGSTPAGSVTGTGGPVSFGIQTVSGTYTAIANLGAGIGCQVSMSGSASVGINALPTAYAVTGGGNYCTGGSGVAVGMSFGASGILYNLNLVGGSTLTSAAGINAATTFGNITTAGTYTVQAANSATGCVNTMSGSVTVGTVNPPAAQTVTGGGSFCSGASGVAVGLGNSVSGTSYQIYNGLTAGSTVSGSGSAITFGNQTTSGVYTVLATLTSGSPSVTCTTAMTGSATVIQNPTPTVFTVGGGGNYCSLGAGSAITLNGSQSGVNYTLYNGAAPVATVAGTGAALSLGTYTAAGTYTVLATNPSTGCTAAMSASAVIAINALPTVYGVGGGGAYCVGGAGYTVTCSGSQTGVNYQFFRDGVLFSTLPGTGGSLATSLQTVAGLYTILAVNATTGCSAAQSGSATIVVNPLPNAYAVTGGGNYCAGSTGVAVGLGGSQTGVNYALYNGATLVTTVNGTASPVTFGIQTVAGTYNVFALTTATGCSNSMTGTATVGINALPTAYAVTGTGNYCAGGTGVALGLSSSTGGITYNLYSGASLVGSTAGTGAPITFGSYTAAATYTVQAVNTSTGCVNAMSGNAIVGINALPALNTVTSSATSYCAGGTGIAIGMSGSEGTASYQLYLGSATAGSAVSGTGAPISFGNKTVAGTYTVIATSAAGCSRNMSGSAVVGIDPLPTVFGVTSSATSYCAGGTGIPIVLTGSESGVSYQLYNGAAAVGSVISGTGSALSLGSYTAAGTYTVLATNSTTTCPKNMSGAATVSINSLPVAQTVTSSGTNYCAGTGGITIGLSNSTTGINYQLYNGVTPVGSVVPGTGSALSLGTQTLAGTYMVVGTNALTGCTNNMTGTATISINPAPTVYAITGGGNYCAGSTGVSIGLSGSNSGINYQLYNGSLAVGSSISGTGAALDFGTYTTTGTYMVIGSNGVTTCSSNMSGTAAVVMNPLPATFAVTGGGGYCNGGAGRNVGLAGSTSGIAYQLYLGTTPVGSPLTGTGLALDFGVKTAGGTYTVVGYNPATTCFVNMTGNAIITVNSLPVVHTVTGGGSYCNGTTTGVNIGLGNSTPGVSYQLYNGTAAAGSSVLGTGAAIDFGAFTSVGTYSVLATSISTTCQNAMSGTATVAINPLPTVQTVTGGGTICQGSTGANVYLNNTQSGVNYQLYNGAAPVGAPVPGTGSSLSFGPQATAGTYTVQATNATTSCMRNMAGTATINVNAQPGLQTVTGGGNYCAGDPGSIVGLGGSNTGINYQLYNGTTAVGGLVPGTGGVITFGVYSATGSYSVMGINALTSCSRTMTGSATIGINALPVVYTLSGGGNVCAGNTSSLILNGSNTGITYQLYNGTTAYGTPVSGTGGPLMFGALTDAGSYNVIATNNTTSCSAYMTGSPSVIVNMPPNAYVMTGGGDYCQGGTGVEVGLNGSNTGVSYQLYKGGAIAGAAVAGTGGDISFGNQMAQGTYTVMATNTSTGCSAPMSSSATVVMNALPTAYTVSGGGTICAGQPGVVVSLSNSTPGYEYQLMNGSVASGPVMLGSGAQIDFAPVTISGTYMVVGTNPATTCSNNMTGSAAVIVNTLPAAQTVTGGGTYCNGAGGVAVGLANSVSGVNYQLMNGATAVGSVVAGTGSAITFGNQTAGTYTVMATSTATSCTNAMTGSATVIANMPPSTYNVISMGSSYCAGGDGVHIMLTNSAMGVQYQLYRAGTVAVGTPVSGTGTMLDMNAQTIAGNYTVMAYDPTSTCSATMAGSAAIVVNPLPTAQTVTGGGGYCSGSNGANIYLSGTQSGISYQLYDASGAVGTPVIGTSGPLSFGPHTAGVYYVIGTNNFTTCTNSMTGTATVVLNAAPTVYSVSGGGAYCAGGAGSEVTLTGSQTGVSYQLMRNGGNIGTPVAGTGIGTLSLGSQTLAGNYTVVAMNNTTSCSSNMTGSVAVSINTLPGTFNVTGGGDFCAGGAGMAVGLSGSAAGVNYQLYRGGTAVSGALLAGSSTAASLNFGPQTVSGSYNVIATSTGNGCTNMMTGSVNVNANALPIAQTMTGGGSYCATPTSTGLAVGLALSQNGVSYQLYKDGTTPVGAPVAGNGGSISFGMQTAAGSYTAVGLNTATTCSSGMSGASVIIVNPAVAPAVTISTGVGTTVCLGVLTNFTAASVNGGIAPAYQWKVNNVNVGLGTNSYAYVPNDGDVVSVSMTSSDACAAPATTSASTTMTVSSHQMPRVAVAVSPNDTICAGTTVTYSATPEFGGAAPTYTWKKNGVNVGSGLTYQYMPTNNDVITCEMTSNFACRLQDVVSTDVKMNVQIPVAPVVSITANPGTTISAGQNVMLTASAVNAGANPSYKWSVNGVGIQGATNATYSSSNFANNDEVTCDVTSNGACLPMVGTKTVVMKITTGVATLSNVQSDIRLLPNPNKGDFIIRGTIGVTDDKELIVEVADMLGQIVYKGKVIAHNGNLNERVQLSNTLANGMYILNLRSDVETKAFYFVMQQ